MLRPQAWPQRREPFMDKYGYAMELQEAEVVLMAQDQQNLGEDKGMITP